MLDPKMENKPELMLPSNIPEDLFDMLFIESHTLLNSVNTTKVGELELELNLLTNIVSDILRVYDIYELYKDNIAALVVMYASWIILESLKREDTIDFPSCNFDTIFDNDLLMQTLETHHTAFEKHIQTVTPVITQN